MSRLAPIASMVLAALCCAPCSGCGEDGAPRLGEIRLGGIRGRVLRAGLPVGAEVALHRHLETDLLDPFAPWREPDAVRHLALPAGAQPPLASVDTDGEGRFAFDAQAPGLYEIHARGGDGAWAATPCVVPGAGGSVSVTVTLPGAVATVQGKALRAGGEPFVGWVGVRPDNLTWPYLWAGGGMHVTRTDAQGRFRLDGTAHGGIEIRLWEPDRLMYALHHVTAPLAGDLTIRLPPDEAGVDGEVLAAEDGKPVAGAEVLAWSYSPLTSLLRRHVADDAGRFHVPLPEGARDVVVRAEGRWPVSLRLEPGERDPLHARLERTATVRGRVLSLAGGKSVSGCRVLVADPFVRRFKRQIWIAWTDAEGRFSLAGLPPTEMVILAGGGGWWSPELADANPRGFNPLAWQLEAGAAQDVFLRVERTGGVHGRVLGPDGAPLVGARVDSRGPSLSDWAKNEFLDLLVQVEGTVTDEAGRFILADLLPGAEVVVLAAARGLPVTRSAPVPVTNGATQEVEITVPRGRWAEVSVFDALDGSPVVGAGVRIEVPDLLWRPGLHPGPWWTDADGRARIGPVSGDVEGLRISADGRFPATPGPTLVAFEERDGVLRADVPMVSSRRIEGTFRGPEDVPLEQARVYVDGSSFDTWPMARERPGGRFTVECPPGWPVSLDADLWWKGVHYGARATVPSDQDEVVMELQEEHAPPMRELRVRVVDPDGRPVSGGALLLVCRTEDRPFHSDRARIQDGAAVLHHPDDAGELSICVVELEDAALGRRVFGPFPPDTDDVTLELGPARTVTGVVLDSSGRGVRGVRVHVSVPDLFGAFFGTVRTDAEGRYEVQGLGPGRWELEFDTPRDHLPVLPLVVEADAGPLTVRLAKAATVTLTVLDADGEPLEGAHLDLQAEDPPDAEASSPGDVVARGPGGSATSGKDGVLHVQRLDPTLTYAFKLEPPSTRSPLLPVIRREWSLGDETIRLRPSMSIRGRVVVEEGRLPERVYVEYRPSGAYESGFLRVQDDGTFVIERLPLGSVEIDVSAWDAQHTRIFESPGRVVAAGTDDLVFVLRVRPEPEPPEPPEPSEPYEPPVLTVRVDSWQPTDERIVAWLWAGGVVTGLRKHLELDAEGRASFEVAEETPHELWIHGGAAGWYVRRSDVQAAEDEIVLTPQPGKSIRGRVLLPADVPPADLDALATSEEGLRARFQVAEDGTFEVRGLPAGPWRLRIRTRRPHAPLAASATASAGTDDVITLTLAP